MSATTGTSSVWVAYLEATARKVLVVVNGATLEKWQTERINENLYALFSMALREDIVTFLALVEFKTVLEARAPTPLHIKAKLFAFGLGASLCKADDLPHRGRRKNDELVG